MKNDVKTNRSIRVLVVGRFNSIHTCRIAEELQRQGAVVAALSVRASMQRPSVLSYQPSKIPRVLGIPKTATLGSILLLRRIIRSFRPEIIHFQEDPFMAKCMRFTSVRGAKLAYTSWGHYSDVLLNDVAFRRSLRDVSLITSDAEDVLAEIAPFAPNALREIIRFGADFGLFSPGTPDPLVLAQYGLVPAYPYVLSPRSLRPNYNQLSLIRSFPVVATRFPNAMIILKHHHVQNYSDSADYERRVYKEAERLGVAKRIIRLDHLPYEHLCHLYRASRVAVSIPLEDGFPATIFESMAAGCPLIVSQDGSYEGVIEDGVNALTVPTGDDDALSNAIVRVLGDETVAFRLSQNGQATVRQKGDFSREVARLLRAYYEVIERRGPN
jgi:glycosyltransferase involved in cell wall biosynthesis